MNKAFTATNRMRTWTAVLNWIWTPSSRLVNEARFGYDRVSFFFYPDDSNVLADGKGYPTNAGVSSPGRVAEYQPFGVLKCWAPDIAVPFTSPRPVFRFSGQCLVFAGQAHLPVRRRVRAHRVGEASYDNGRGRIDFPGQSNL